MPAIRIAVNTSHRHRCMCIEGEHGVHGPSCKYYSQLEFEFKTQNVTPESAATKKTQKKRK